MASWAANIGQLGRESGWLIKASPATSDLLSMLAGYEHTTSSGTCISFLRVAYIYNQYVRRFILEQAGGMGWDM